jgi:predicted SAM-dependent methyltransferase
LGCQRVILPNWINLDLEDLPGVDIQDDARTLNKIPNESCDIIYASHVLEHFGRHEFESVLKTWNKKLKLFGILRLSVPDFEKAVAWYNKTKQILDIVGSACGGQRTKNDYHKMIFDKPTLTEILTKCGFGNICEWDWRKTEHCEFDDYSQAYLPHMDKEKGMLMSLNLEASKIRDATIENMHFGKSPWQ